MKPFSAAALALAVSVTGASGCTTSAGVSGEVVYGYPAVTVETVPVHVHHTPHVVYRGRYAYLYHDRWYYPSSRGWVVFRDEPRELQRYRVYYRDHRRFPPEVRPAPVYRPTRPGYRPSDGYRYREPAYGAPHGQRRYYR